MWKIEDDCVGYDTIDNNSKVNHSISQNSNIPERSTAANSWNDINELEFPPIYKQEAQFINCECLEYSKLQAPEKNKKKILKLNSPKLYGKKFQKRKSYIKTSKKKRNPFRSMTKSKRVTPQKSKSSIHFNNLSTENQKNNIEQGSEVTKPHKKEKSLIDINLPTKRKNSRCSSNEAIIKKSKPSSPRIKKDNCRKKLSRSLIKSISKEKLYLIWRNKADVCEEKSHDGEEKALLCEKKANSKKIEGIKSEDTITQEEIFENSVKIFKNKVDKFLSLDSLPLTERKEDRFKADPNYKTHSDNEKSFNRAYCKRVYSNIYMKKLWDLLITAIFTDKSCEQLSNYFGFDCECVNKEQLACVKWQELERYSYNDLIFYDD